MPFDITCTHCHRTLRVPDDGAGKHVKCPQCQTVVLAPQGGNPAAVGTTVATAELWQMKGADGQTYGPIPRAELDQWCREGRIVASTQVLRAGGGQWQWATDLYPHLTQAAANPGFGAANGSPFGKGGPAPAAPFAGQVNPYSPGGYAANAGAYPLSDKSRIAAGLLGIFLGAYGIHRFYLGDAGMGVTQLLVTFLTCGLGGIWGFIEGIMILTGSIDRDAMGRKLRD